MIRLFNHTETNFTHNGVHVLDDIVIGDTCILNNEINGVYSLECEVAMFNNSKWKDIEAEMVLKVPTSKGEQLFRIKEVVKGFNTIKIYGKHIFFDLENNFILDTNIVKKDGRSAIAQILGGMSNNMLNAYTGTSDISIINNSRLVRKNVVTALIGDGENSFLNRWGGELELDNFNFSINERIGSDRGFQIRYGKNATGYEGNINTYNLCTRIVPVGFDGLMLEGTKWVDSPNIAKYPQIYTYEVKFEDIKVKENEDDEEGYNTIEEAREALREAALNHFNNTKCDLPSFSARVNFITLQNTEEYKDVKSLERVELGDDVSIYLSNIDVNASSRVVREKWNFFTKKHVELEIGEIKPNVFKQLINIKDTIDNIVENLGGNTWQDIINKSLDEATKLMEEGLKGSHVITMKNQIVIGDAPDIKDMVNCIVFNKNGIGFSNDGYLPDRLVSAMTIDGKINASCITVGTLNAALIKAGTLMSSNGSTWINMEDGTFNFANKIKFDGDNFSIDLSSGDLSNNNSFSNLKSEVETSKTNISNLQIKADSIESTVSSQSSSINGINQEISNIKQTANSIQSTVSSQSTKISNAENRITNAESVINQQANQISSKVSSGDVVSLIEQNPNSVKISFNKINSGVYIDSSGFTVKNGSIYIKNKNDQTVFTGDANGNIDMRGSISTINSYGKLYLNGNKLQGYENDSTNVPCYSAGIWSPQNNTDYTGFVSVSNTNSLSGDDEGCLYMSGWKGNSYRKAILQYSRYQGSHTGTVEFSPTGSVSLVSKSASYNSLQYGIWNSAEGYIYPYRGDEYLGSSSKRWGALYANKINGTTVSALVDESALVDTIDDNYSAYSVKNKIIPTKNDFVECVKNMEFGIYDTGAKIMFSSNELEENNRYCSPIITTASTLDDNSNVVKDLLVKDNKDRDGSKQSQSIDLTTYCSILAITLQETLKKIEILEEKIKILEGGV